MAFSSQERDSPSLECWTGSNCPLGRARFRRLGLKHHEIVQVLSKGPLWQLPKTTLGWGAGDQRAPRWTLRKLVPV